ncbi:hypothetical protein [Nocardioides sp. GXQ0305]|uniref:hypothetical protein n=1 Tax=Nocardioides sp. GXQ0305 TaxID=3423912 RepID=UPI003D7E916F
MITPLRIAAFVVTLGVLFLAARGVGSAVGPLDVDEEPMAHAEGGGDEMASGGHDDHAAEAADHRPGGLAVSDQGYTLQLVSRPRAGVDQPLRFVVLGPDAEPVTAYDEVHEKQLHLIKVRRDGAGFEHVHPRLAPDGTWTARMTLAPGSNRLLADFTPTDGPELVLGTDVEVPGDYRPTAAAPLTRTARVDDYRVRLTGSLTAGKSSPVTATVTRDGRPVTDLQPYLGAYGHLVALREGDLAYLHVHPEQSDAGPEIPFVAEVPSDGRYRLFLDFRHRGTVRTAAFTLRAGEAGPAVRGTTGAHPGEGEGHDH